MELEETNVQLQKIPRATYKQRDNLITSKSTHENNPLISKV